MSWIALLRLLRTAAYRLAGPCEAALRRLRRRSQLPPLWLRRHVGPPSRFESAARETAAWIDRLSPLAPASVILDVGCGCGAMVPAFAARLGASGSYVGFDVHAPSIAWCRLAFAGDPRFRFELAALRTPYSRAANAPSPSQYVFPAGDGAVDLVLAKSVFTHLLEEDARRYLAEIGRVLHSGGRALVSFFLFAVSEEVPPAFSHPNAPQARVRWRIAGRPHAAVAYEKTFALSLIEAAGLEVVELVPGFFPGRALRPEGQDLLLLRRAEDGSVTPFGSAIEIA